MCHKNRKRHVLENVPGGAAEKEFSPRRMTIRSHDNQVGIRFIGDIQHSGACLPIMGLESPGRDLGRVPREMPHDIELWIACYAAEAFLASANQNRHVFRAMDERDGSVNGRSRLLASVPGDEQSLTDRGFA
jgi:hypothetical protein